MKICPACLRCYEDQRSRCTEASHPPLEREPGPLRLADRYLLERLISRRPRATVFAARHLEIDRPVAIKIVSRELVSGPDGAARFRRAAAASNALHHANVAAVYDFGTLSDGRAYIVMELVEGETLSQLLAYSGALPLASALEIGRQVAEAISAAHKSGVIHGNLESSDVLLSRELGRAIVKVVGFGFGSRAAGDVGAHGPDEFGARAYAAPELRGGGEPDARTDVHGVGVLLYEMLAGRTPYETPGPASANERSAVRPLAAVRPEVPEALGWVVMQAIHENPIRRHKNGGELVERLSPFEAEITGRASSPAAAPPAPVLMSANPAEPAERAPASPPAAAGRLPRAPVEPARPAPIPYYSRTRRGTTRRTRGGRAFVYAALAAGLAAAGAYFWTNVHTSAVSAGARAREAPRSGARPGAIAKREPTAARPAPSISAEQEASPAPAPPTIAASAAPSPSNLEETARAGSSAPSPTASRVDGGGARAELRRALDEWIAATNARDSRRVMRSYMPRVETFYLARNVSSAYVRDVKRRVIDRARRVHVRASALEIQMDPQERSATLRFQKTYEIDSGREIRRGELLQEMRWVRTADGWKIVGEKDAKVIR